jgi:hypothetical protein
MHRICVEKFDWITKLTIVPDSIKNKRNATENNGPLYKLIYGVKLIVIYNVVQLLFMVFEHYKNKMVYIYPNVFISFRDNDYLLILSIHD